MHLIGSSVDQTQLKKELKNLKNTGKMCEFRKEVAEVRHLKNIDGCVGERRGVHSNNLEEIARVRGL